MSVRNLQLFIFVLNIISGASSWAQNKGITFQAMIKDTSGKLVSASGVSVNAKVLAPNGCILREENFSGASIVDGWLSLAIAKGTVGGSDPGLSVQQVFDNALSKNGLTCIAVDGSVNGSITSYVPTSSDVRKLRIEFVNGSDTVVADFNMRSMPFASNSETLNGIADTGFVKINGAQNLNQTNAESIFNRYTKLDAILNNFNTAGTALGANITGNAATATSAVNVTGTVAVANGGTGATSVLGARANLGLGTLATMSPTGTADNTTYLRGDGTWGVVSSGGAVSSVAGRTGAVTLSSSDLTDGSSLIKSSQMPANCSLGQTLTFSSPTGAWVCANITIDAAQVTSGTIAVARLPVGTIASTVAAGDDARIINSIQNVGSDSSSNIVKMSAGLDAAKPASPVAGQVFMATDTQQIYRHDGSAWVVMASAGGGGGAVSTVSSTNSDISIATGSTTPTLTLNSGTGANQIVKLDGFAKLPAVDGSALTNITLTFDKLVNATANYFDYKPNNVACNNNEILKYQTGTGWVCASATTGAVISVTAAETANNPIVIAGTESAPTVDIPAATSSVNGYLKSGDWTTFNSKQAGSSELNALAGIGLTGIIQRTGAGAYTALGTTAPINVTAGNIGISIGAGLTTNAGILVADFATTSTAGKVVQANDARLPSSTCASGNKMRWTGSEWVCEADADTPTTGIVAVANGGTGTSNGSITGSGALTFAAGGTDQNITLTPSGAGSTALNGNVGIGTSLPRASLDVQGAFVTKAATLNSNSTIDFSKGNFQYTNDICQAFSLYNLKDGGTYKLSVRGTISSLCSFTAYNDSGSTLLSINLPSDHSATVGTRRTLFTFEVVGPDVYVSSNIISEACSAGNQTFSTPGTYTFEVPAGCSSVVLKLWGGGGAGGNSSTAGSGGAGGGGGFVKQTLTLASGEKLTIVVGGGGAVENGGSSGGGSGSQSAFYSMTSGGGGGGTFIYRNSSIILAAGGGGGGGAGQVNNSTAACNGAAGGAGGATGVAGGIPSASASCDGPGWVAAGGGTASAGGAAGVGIHGSSTAGSSLAGGNGSLGNGRGGGGGGGGYFGGGGGGGGWSGAGGGGGGGGSSYASSGGATFTSGSGRNPGGSAEAGFISGYATGGAAVTSSGPANSGTSGLVYISW